MAGTGGINFERPTVQIWWEQGDVDPSTPVVVRAVNAESGDVGIKLDTNDGYTNLTFPAGFQGTDHITVSKQGDDDDDGELIAEFDISVKVGG